MNTFMMNPTIEIESAYGTREVSIRTHLLSKRQVFIVGEITPESAISVIQQLMYLDDGSNEPITLYISSPGGSVSAGLAIYDVLQSMKCPLDMVCLGTAASMGALLMASGEKGHRYMLPHSRLMIHEPLIGGGGISGSASSIRRISEEMIKTRELTNSILAKHTGRSVEEIDEATAFDNYMNADEALAFGLIDFIKEDSLL